MEENWKFDHVGVVVRDMDKAVEYYQSLGIGTFEPEVTVDRHTYKDLKIYGKTPDPDTIPKTKIRFGQIGSLRLELMQPIEGESFHNEFLDSKGEGIEHIGFTVDDLDKETAKLVDKGVPIIMSGKIPAIGGLGIAHFDTRKVGNVIIELLQPRVIE